MNESDKQFVRRKYTLTSGNVVEIIVTHPTRADIDWYCEYTINWPGEPPLLGKRPGIDQLDALLRTIKILEAQLNDKAERSGVRITWDGNPDIGLSL